MNFGVNTIANDDHASKTSRTLTQRPGRYSLGVERVSRGAKGSVEPPSERTAASGLPDPVLGNAPSCREYPPNTSGPAEADRLTDNHDGWLSPKSPNSAERVVLATASSQNSARAIKISLPEFVFDLREVLCHP